VYISFNNIIELVYSKPLVLTYPTNKQTLTSKLQVTLFLPNHERNSAGITSTIYEYRFRASPEYLQKLDQPYNASKSDMIIYRRTIPLRNKAFNVLFQAVRRAVGCKKADCQAEEATNAIKKGTTISSSHPVDLKKRKALDKSNSNISKRAKSSSNKERQNDAT